MGVRSLMVRAKGFINTSGAPFAALPIDRHHHAGPIADVVRGLSPTPRKAGVGASSESCSSSSTWWRTAEIFDQSIQGRWSLVSAGASKSRSSASRGLLQRASPGRLRS
jgi:hypothetical protein